MTGILYIVATPIGNLSDISNRALETLKNVDYILSEDTRETQKLLARYDIQASQLIYTDQKHTKTLPKIIKLLQEGKNLALVSDSGMPVISDPGYKLIRELRRLDINIDVIPGPDAITSALAISGLPTDKFVFLGFLPKGSSQRKKILEKYGKLDATLTIFESPYRLGGLVQDIFDVLGHREVSLVKDLTKKHQKVITLPIKDVLAKLDDVKKKGEYVVLVAKEGFCLRDESGSSKSGKVSPR
ncbi:16S rRNA (cytidine(1402)-2'-O)-methyltransferase [Patescibacteria group bacterium]